jgi:hypothetical protein
MRTDLARRVHDLVRQSEVRTYFLSQVQNHIAYREDNPSLAWPLHIWAELDPDPQDSFREVTLIAKYAVLAANHDNVYANDGPILPRPDCTDQKSRLWYIMMGHVRDHLARHALRAEDWYKDVVADLNTAGLKAGTPPLERAAPGEEWLPQLENPQIRGASASPGRGMRNRL